MRITTKALPSIVLTTFAALLQPVGPAQGDVADETVLLHSWRARQELDKKL